MFKVLPCDYIVPRLEARLVTIKVTIILLLQASSLMHSPREG